MKNLQKVEPLAPAADLPRCPLFIIIVVVVLVVIFIHLVVIFIHVVVVVVVVEDDDRLTVVFHRCDKVVGSQLSHRDNKERNYCTYYSST